MSKLIPDQNPAQAPALTPNPAPDTVDQVPLTAMPVVPDADLFRYRHMRDSLMNVTAPAQADLTSVATRQLGTAGMQNGLGTQRAPYGLPGFDPTHQFFYLIPLVDAVPGSVPLSYEGGRATCNMYAALASVHRLAPDGRRELYPLKPTPGKVTIGNTVGYGLYCKLSEVTSEPLGTLTDEQKAKREATRKRNQEKKKHSGGTAATGD